jgi:methyl halide transferase
MSQDFPSRWHEKWQTQETAWDLKRPHPLLSQLLGAMRALPLSSSIEKILVPGCGLGHEAASLADQGFQVTGTDLVADATRMAKQTYGDKGNLKFVTDDVFATRLKPLTFDGLMDRAMLCALEPGRRKDYLDFCHQMLGHGGVFMGILFSEVSCEGGPPFAINAHEVLDLFTNKFSLAYLQEVKGGDHGSGLPVQWEMLCILIKKG